MFQAERVEDGQCHEIGVLLVTRYHLSQELSHRLVSGLGEVGDQIEGHIGYIAPGGIDLV